MNTLELRMYGLVCYQLTGIQQGIQYGHAVVEYGMKHNNEEYKDWAKNWKTFIILNGGTTNTNPNRLGTMNQHLVTLKKLGVKLAPFYEPDLGDQLTAITFILDERVFNKKQYPDYNEWLVVNSRIDDKHGYLEWKKMIGGDKNIKLRDFISRFRLA